jgi:hypothetical protein
MHSISNAMYVDLLWWWLSLVVVGIEIGLVLRATGRSRSVCQDETNQSRTDRTKTNTIQRYDLILSKLSTYQIL